MRRGECQVSSDGWTETEKTIKKNLRLLALCAMLLALSSSADAQQPKKIPRIGFLSAGSTNSMSGRVEAFRRGLREQGYTEGQNILVEYRYAEDSLDRLRQMAAELARLKLDVIVTGGPIATLPAKETAGTIPIVLAYEADPVRTGLIASLARPGGNITGLTSNAEELNGKRLELLKEAIPKLSRVAALRNPVMLGAAEALKDVELAAQSLGLKIQALEIRGPNELDGIFQAAKKGRAGALMTIGDPVSFMHRKRVADLAIKNHLATIHGQVPFAEAGGLMVYGPNDGDMYRRAATFVDKILKGTKPADLPVERPVKFDLIINLKTAKQIGLTIPPDLLARATKIIK
jgi:putative tryptophan/tyrosine transport system substrate-binding protein